MTHSIVQWISGHNFEATDNANPQSPRLAYQAVEYHHGGSPHPSNCPTAWTATTKLSTSTPMYQLPKSLPSRFPRYAPEQQPNLHYVSTQEPVHEIIPLGFSGLGGLRTVTDPGHPDPSTYQTCPDSIHPIYLSDRSEAPRLICHTLFPTHFSFPGPQPRPRGAGGIPPACAGWFPSSTCTWGSRRRR